MKNRTTNGSASQAGETITTKETVEQVFTESVLDAEDREYQARLKAMQERRMTARKKITIEIGADTYGYLCAAGVVHDGTPEDVAAAFLDERVSDWTNDDYYLDDVEI